MKNKSVSDLRADIIESVTNKGVGDISKDPNIDKQVKLLEDNLKNIKNPEELKYTQNIIALGKASNEASVLMNVNSATQIWQDVMYDNANKPMLLAKASEREMGALKNFGEHLVERANRATEVNGPDVVFGNMQKAGKMGVGNLKSVEAFKEGPLKVLSENALSLEYKNLLKERENPAQIDKRQESQRLAKISGGIQRLVEGGVLTKGRAYKVLIEAKKRSAHLAIPEKSQQKAELTPNINQRLKAMSKNLENSIGNSKALENLSRSMEGPKRGREMGG